MAVNKVVYGTTTLVDLTDTTATADKILEGYGAYGKDGEWMDGTASAGGATVAVATETPSSNSTSITFDVEGKPLMFAVQWSYTSGSYMSGSSTRYITSVISDGTHCYGSSVYRSGSTGREYFYSTASFSYSNGKLTVTSPASNQLGYFRSGYTYRLIYVY